MSYLPAGQNMACQLHFGKIALADGLEQPVVADVRLFVRAGGDGIPATGSERATRPSRALL